MLSALEIAKFYIHLASDMADAEIGEYMTHLKLQKMLYFTQGEYLAIHGEPLFSGVFEAWKLGPVLSEVYQQYRKYGANPLPNEYSNQLPDDVKQFLMDVDKTYGAYSAAGLVSLSHETGSPWEKSYIPDRRAYIPNELMRDYFLVHRKVIPFSETLKKLHAHARQLPQDTEGNILIRHPEDDPWRSDDA